MRLQRAETLNRWWTDGLSALREKAPQGTRIRRTGKSARKSDERDWFIQKRHGSSYSKEISESVAAATAESPAATGRGFALIRKALSVKPNSKFLSIGKRKSEVSRHLSYFGLTQSTRVPYIAGVATGRLGDARFGESRVRQQCPAAISLHSGYCKPFSSEPGKTAIAEKSRRHKSAYNNRNAGRWSDKPPKIGEREKEISNDYNNQYFRRATAI
jgi:hypothetical protein